MPKINPQILCWARETAGLDLEAAAHKLQIQDGKAATAAQKLFAYENGDSDPSRSLLLRMSKVYRRPLLIFYLDRPPTIGDRGQDFRTLPEEFIGEDLARVDVLIRELKARQSMVRDVLLDDDDVVPLPYVASINSNQSINEAVFALRQLLHVDLEEYRSKADYGDAFKYLRKQAEDAGIFVLLKGNLGTHHTNIDVRAFRGLALSDDIAPFVVINNRDAKSAWSFTLLHEVTHILLGQTGISGSFPEQQIEKFCNAVASEFLLPDNEFLNFSIQTFDAGNIVGQISRYAFSMKLSSSHIAYRLYKRGDIDKSQWKLLSDYYRKQWLEQCDRQKAKSKEQDDGPSYYVVQKFKLGALVNLARRLNYSGLLSTTKAGMLLDVKPLKVYRLFETEQMA